MTTFTEKSADIDVAEPEDEDYNPPSASGCWFCNRGDGNADEDMSFDIEFDTFYHDECLETTGADTILEHERQ